MLSQHVAGRSKRKKGGQYAGDNHPFRAPRQVENPGHLLYERLPGFHLSDVGVRMAQATAHYIAVSPQLNTVSAVYSSPLERTRETAGRSSNR